MQTRVLPGSGLAGNAPFLARWDLCVYSLERFTTAQADRLQSWWWSWAWLVGRAWSGCRRVGRVDSNTHVADILFTHLASPCLPAGAD